MYSLKKIAGSITGVILCSLLVTGCSGDQEKKEAKTAPTVQEQHTQAMKSAIDKAEAVSEQVQEKVEQTVKEVAEQTGEKLDTIAEENKEVAEEASHVPAKAGKKVRAQLEGC